MTQEVGTQEQEQLSSFFSALTKHTTAELHKKLNICLYGRFGSGKTTALLTCRKPVLIICCDPNGVTSISRDIKEDPFNFLTYRVTERELDPEEPKAYALLYDLLLKIEKLKVYNHIGTLAIDGVSMLSDSIMRYVIAEDTKHKVVHPMQHHYNPMMARMQALVRRVTGYPCDVVFTAHEAVYEDKLRGISERTPLFTGKTAKENLPALLDEIYRVSMGNTGETEPVMQVMSDGGIAARSRAQGKRLERDRIKMASPDIRGYLKACGWPLQDHLPNLLEQGFVDESHNPIVETVN